jgi:hypothetical protein
MRVLRAIGREGFAAERQGSRIALDTCPQAWQNEGCVHYGAWRSLVARLPWAQEVRGSNPRAPTNIPKGLAPKAISRKVPVRTNIKLSIGS